MGKYIKRKELEGIKIEDLEKMTSRELKRVIYSQNKIIKEHNKAKVRFDPGFESFKNKEYPVPKTDDKEKLKSIITKQRTALQSPTATLSQWKDVNARALSKATGKTVKWAGKGRNVLTIDGVPISPEDASAFFSEWHQIMESFNAHKNSVAYREAATKVVNAFKESRDANDPRATFHNLLQNVQATIDNEDEWEDEDLPW